MGLQYITVGVLLLMGSCLLYGATSDKTKDKEECTEQLVGLATCLPYVGGEAKAPTPDCCSGLKQVLKSNKKCLCVIIEERNDPELGLNINATLALGLPTICSAPANVSQCPALLHLAPNSSEAQVFYQFGHTSNDSASSPTTASSVSANSTSGAKAKGTPEKNEGCCSGKRCLGMETIVGGLLFWFITSLLLP